MSFDLEFIILNYTRVGENALVLHTLSREYGRKGFLLRVGKKTSMSRFLPLSVLEGKITMNPHNDLWRIDSINTVHPLNGIRNNIYKNTMTMFMSEVLYRVIKDGANEEGLYDWCMQSILALDAFERDFSNFHILFLLQLSSVLGFSPSVESMMPFAVDHRQQMENLLTLPYAGAMLLPLNGEERNLICGEIIKYLEHHSDSALEIRSLGVLREIFA